MAAQIIDGKESAAQLRSRLAWLKEEHGITPRLAVVLVCDDPASEVYLRNKGRQTIEGGMNGGEHKLPTETSQADLLALIEELNSDPDFHGILVRLPPPEHLNADLVTAIDPAKDVDGFHISNVGLLGTGQNATVPCTSLGCLMLVRSHLGDLSGFEAVVVGRWNIVGKPMAQLLLNDSCTVAIAHSRTRDLASFCRRGRLLSLPSAAPR